MTKWINDRIKERTTWDGAVLVIAGLAMLLAPTNIIGLGCIAYGAWTIYKSE
jgi:hypothetical protein